jgi:hypothetical protein
MGFKAAGKAAATVLPALLERESKKTKTPPDASAAAQPEVKSGGSRHLLKGALRKPIALWHENVAGTGGVGKNNSRPAPQNLAEVREYVASGLRAIVKAEPAMQYAQQATAIPMPGPGSAPDAQPKQRSVMANRLMKELGETVKNQASGMARTARDAWRKNAAGSVKIGRAKVNPDPKLTPSDAAAPEAPPGPNQEFATAFKELPKHPMLKKPASGDLVRAGDGDLDKRLATETEKLKASQAALADAENESAKLAADVGDALQSLGSDLDGVTELSDLETAKQLALARREEDALAQPPSPKSVLPATPAARPPHEEQVAIWKQDQMGERVGSGSPFNYAVFVGLDPEMIGTKGHQRQLTDTNFSSPPPSSLNPRITSINFSGNKRFTALPDIASSPNARNINLTECPIQDFSGLENYPKGCTVRVTYNKLGAAAKEQFDAYQKNPVDGIALVKV